MKKLLIILTVVCLIFPSCKKTPVITLSVDKSEISANGIDVAKFKVICNDEDDVTNEARIFFADTNKELTGKTFSTTEAKTYTFYATYDDATSGKITVKAVEVIDDNDDDDDDDDDEEVVLELSVNKTSISADGEDAAVFTVKADGNVLSENYQVFNVADNSLVENGSFVTTEAGSYTFVALYNEVYSNEVTIEAEAVEVPDPKTYALGDLYDVNGVKGVVFYVEEDGNSGMIMSMDQEYLQWSTEYAWANCLSNKGEWNTEDMLKLGADKYPAAKWCVEHGEGWYMPSSYEMNLMWTAVSDGKLDFDPEFVKLYNDKLEDPIIEDYYWSSSEISEDMAEVVVFIDDSVVCLEPKKDRFFHVRAVRKF